MDCWRKNGCLFNSNFVSYKKCISHDNYSVDKCEAEHKNKKIKVVKDLNYEIIGEIGYITGLIGKEFNVIEQQGTMVLIDIGDGYVEALFKGEYEWVKS